MASSSRASLPRLLRARMHERMRTRLGRSDQRVAAPSCVHLSTLRWPGGGYRTFALACRARCFLGGVAHMANRILFRPVARKVNLAKLPPNSVATRLLAREPVFQALPPLLQTSAHKTQTKHRHARKCPHARDGGTARHAHGHVRDFLRSHQPAASNVCASCALGQANFSTHADAHNTATPKFVPAPEACWGPYARRAPSACAAAATHERRSCHSPASHQNQSARMWRRATEQRRVSERFA